MIMVTYLLFSSFRLWVGVQSAAVSSYAGTAALSIPVSGVFIFSLTHVW